MVWQPCLSLAHMLSDLLHLDARNLVHERARARAMALKHTALNLPCGHDSSSPPPHKGTCHEPLTAAAREAISLILSVTRRNAPLDTVLVPKP